MFGSFCSEIFNNKFDKFTLRFIFNYRVERFLMEEGSRMESMKGNYARFKSFVRLHINTNIAERSTY